jgi:GDP/UDP-N,N'-diacetylbacillosamine 2-epimerase (hydrolysing)
MSNSTNLNRNPMRPDIKRKICFVTGTRADFGLMRRSLAAIRDHASLDLQLVVTGMHLSTAHGRTTDEISRGGWRIDASIPWEQGNGLPSEIARATGLAMAELATCYRSLGSDVVLVVGDRVEAFAAASAAQVSQVALAHVHGGDLAEGQVDDSLRHAISKLSHLHLCATEQSGARLIRMGEDPSRVHAVGAPGVEGIAEDAANPESFPEPPGEGRASLHGPHGTHPGYRDRGPCFAVVLLHPTSPDESIEHRRAREVLDAVLVCVPRVVLLDPNNDPGHKAIASVWGEAASDPRVMRMSGSVPRGAFLGLLRDTAVLVGNSSSGIIEAGALRTPVVNVGPRQSGRERGSNVIDASHDAASIQHAVRECLRRGRVACDHPYAKPGTAGAIAALLERMDLHPGWLRKRNSY